MSKGRLEAFSDGVLAIIITLMVLDLKAPSSSDLNALVPLIPSFACYLLSFVFVGIYWNNHHHLFQAVRRVDGKILWANLHLLFWLSLTPFVTAWMGQTNLGIGPVVSYGVVLLGAGVAFSILVRVLIAQHGAESVLAKAIGSDFKGNLSILLYALAIASAYVDPRIACGVYILVAMIWLVPDPRLEKRIGEE